MKSRIDSLSNLGGIVLLLMVIAGAISLPPTHAQEPTSTIIVIDNFDYTDPTQFRWELGISENGIVNLLLDNQVIAPEANNVNSLLIETSVPCQDSRFEYLQIALDGPSLVGSNVLEFWIKSDESAEPPFVGELSVALIEQNGEYWQSSHLIDRKQDWQFISIQLIGNSVGAPLDHPADFVMPDGAGQNTDNGLLDLDKVNHLRIATISPNAWACGTTVAANGTPYPNFKVWLDQIVVRKTANTVIDNFEYTTLSELPWEALTTEGGRINLQLDPSNIAPTPANTQSLQIQTSLGCIEDDNRNAYIQMGMSVINRDWSTSKVLRLWVRGDGSTELPPVGLLSVALIEESGEVWMSRQPIPRQDDWQQLVIRLDGNTIDNPSNHPTDFTIPVSAQARVVDGVLDLTNIRSLRISIFTPASWACGTVEAANGNQFPDFTLWIDNITRE